MILTVKTIKGDNFTVEVAENSSVTTLKQTIGERQQIDPAQIKLIYKGKALEDGKQLQEYGIVDKDFLVIIVSVKKPQTQITEVVPQETQQQIQEPKVEVKPQEEPKQQSQIDTELVTSNQTEQVIKELMSMGFQRDKIEQALKASFNNANRAVEYLLSGHIPTAEEIEQEQEISEENPFASLMQEPIFNQLRAIVQQDPSLINQILPQIQQSNPQLYELISQNQELFVQLLLGNQEESGQAPQQAYIQITQQEQEAINRIQSLGFDKRDVLEAYFTCDKNEELTLNYLCEQQAAGELACKNYFYQPQAQWEAQDKQNNDNEQK